MVEDKTYPFLYAKGWSLGSRMEAGRMLDKMPESVRAAVADLCSERAVPPKTQAAIIENVSKMTAQERREWVKLYRSDAKQDVSLAHTRAVKQPPMPPASLALLDAAIHSCETAAKQDDFVGKRDVASVLAAIKKLLQKNEEAYQALRRREGFSPRTGQKARVRRARAPR